MNNYRVNPNASINGTSFQSYLGTKVTAEVLTAKFGASKEHCEKVEFQWTFVCTQSAQRGRIGRVFTVYDYKSGINSDTPYDWHIGAMNDVGVEEFRTWLLAELAR